MKKFTIIILNIISFILVFYGTTAMAQEAQAVAEVDTITVIANMIRWGGVLMSLFIMFGAWLLLRFVDAMVANFGRVFAERRMLLQKLNAFFHFGVYLAVIVITIMLSFQISREVLAILGGASAVAIGFALKDLVASVVAGVMIMIDRPFQVGDRVTFGGQYGDITAIGLRSVRLQTLDDNTVTIPNNMFLNQISSSGNYGVLDMQVVVDFHIGIDQNVKLAQSLVREAAATSRFVYLPKPVVTRVSQVTLHNCVALRVRVKLYVLDTKYEKALVSDITLRVMEVFEQHGIGPPELLFRHVAGEPLLTSLS
ncbi:MAG: mechanosensitive ion channel family protein [Deltaproteobacteria bacterium]|nr:mechanosensitive ion channel family protein [Deltaproteobacteria bacterium]MBT8355914.1 mechanosensitive ion channel family protein [Desulfofustis sp.]